ncbi:MAG: metal-dependent transcriptional regulator [Candidatus Eremiobacteraeota bacterium]|nr:metal-dependent transcriptional regulator [Candidatus Eremiobacteraeota bacterium]MBC5828369.1 metal-dependent transcriptional regulator [Candidatus Eremiobacteraeota bacterium]
MVNKQVDRSRARAQEDYLKAIYHLNCGAPVKAAPLARHLKVSRAAVTMFRRVLEKDGLVEVAADRVEPMTLTRRGLAIAVSMVRRHRLVETFLHRSLGVPLDRLHRNAEKIEHAISHEIERRLANFLGNPSTDPHGHVIPPSVDARGPTGGAPLIAMTLGQSIEVTALDDADERALRRLTSLGALPGFRGIVVKNDGTGVCLRAGRKVVSLSSALAARVRCAVWVDCLTA